MEKLTLRGSEIREIPYEFTDKESLLSQIIERSEMLRE